MQTQVSRFYTFKISIMACLVILQTTSCAWMDEQSLRTNELLRRMKKMEDDLKESKHRQETLNTTISHNVSIALGKLFCTDPRVQTFLRACNSQDPASPCPDKMRESILTFMASQRHAVVYLADGKRRQDIRPARKSMLQQLLKETRLMSTEFWVFANPNSLKITDVQEAERRANEVVDAMKEISQDMQNEILQKLPPGTKLTDDEEPAELIELKNIRIHSPQVFKMRLSGGDIEPVLRKNNQMDRPIGIEPKDLGKGIWVFRTDCGVRG